jgi:hypothetical protein
MALKVTNLPPVVNGAQNLALQAGMLNVPFQFDEAGHLVQAFLDDGAGHITHSTFEGIFVPANTSKTVPIKANASTTYSLTLQGENANGLGSSTITITTAAQRRR